MDSHRTCHNFLWGLGAVVLTFSGRPHGVDKPVPIWGLLLGIPLLWLGWLKPELISWDVFTTYQLVIRISLAHPPYDWDDLE